MNEINFSKHALDVMIKRDISKALVFETINNYSLKVNVSNDEEHYYKTIESKEDRCLKVVLNPKTLNVITVYFDRNMRKRGCKQMTIRYDKKSDSVYFILTDEVPYESEEIKKDVIVDYDKDEKITSIEILNFKENNFDLDIPVLGDFFLKKAS